MELLITLTLFSLVAMVSFVLMSKGGELWRESSGQHSATLALSSAGRHLESELNQTSFPMINTATVPSSLAGAPDGSCIWFLSARDTTTDTFARKNDGTPFWQRNILYYTVVPQNHQALYGMTCAGGGGPDNDSHCPHKLLIRVEIDSGPVTSPTSDTLTTEETLLADISGYLLRPNGLDTSNISAPPEVTSAKIVSNGILYFEATLDPSEVNLDIRAVSTEGLGRVANVGSESLLTSRYTFQYLNSIFPRN